MRDFICREAPDSATVVVRFAEKRARDVPLFVAACQFFSQAYYTKRPFDESTLDVPLGSGAYKVGRFEPAATSSSNGVKNWWGENLPVSIGQNNFDVLRYEYYRDRDVGFEGFTAKSYLFREEFTSRIWATRYDFPALRDGRSARRNPDDTPSGAQGWFINTRRKKFDNPKFREALNYAFDFEWTNKNIMYGAYQRTHSVFQNSDMMANGKPDAEELALLEPFRSQVPAEVFGEAFVPPVSDGSGQDRALLRKATQNPAGRRLRHQERQACGAGRREPRHRVLIEEPSFQPHHAPFIKNLATIGIDATLRIVDATQMQARRNDFDFDITIQRFGFSTSPGDSLRSYFFLAGGRAEGLAESRRHRQSRHRRIDRQDHRRQRSPDDVTACRALDRVIRAGQYWIPHWYKASHWIAFWDVFARRRESRATRAVCRETWWYDRERASKIERAG